MEYKSDLIDELDDLPEGEFFCAEENGRRKYYQRLPVCGNRKKERRYGIKTRPEIFNGLVRKEYVTRALRSIDRNIKAIDHAFKTYDPIDENSVMSAFIAKYPELTSKIYYDSFEPEAWMGDYLRIDNYHSESLKQTAIDGTRMRSKNEVFIASRLDHYGLIYRTDCPTGIPGLKNVPDFTILRKWDYKRIFWEHFGMMSDPDYRRYAKNKIEEYEAFGIVPWDNLILTYDTSEGYLRADLIEATIQGWLL